MSTEGRAIGPIRLDLPPHPELSRVARLTASVIASLAGFTIDEIEDIKVAVSEVMVALVEHGAREPISVVFDVADDRFSVRGTTPIPGFDVDHPDLVLCRTVLGGVSTDHHIRVVEAGVEIRAIVDHAAR